MAISMPEGDHELVLRDMTFPRTWHRQFQPVVNTEVQGRPLQTAVTHRRFRLP
jgi:hypothetical protein